ncbi:hypothetical protein D3C84_1308850 [compost metagenome]
MCRASDISMRWSEMFGRMQMPLVKIGSKTKEWSRFSSLPVSVLVSKVLLM